MAKIFNENKGNESIPRNLIFDTTLSDRARFVYCYMSAKPEGWDFVLAPMAKELGYSVETLRKYIAELVESGWIIKGEQGYDKETGKFSNVDYTIKNSPSPCRKKPVSVKTRDGKNHTQDINSSINTPLNKDYKDKENKLSNDNSKSDYSDDFLEFWEAYGYSRDKGTTYKRWKNLSKKDKEAALKALPDYFADCKRCDRKKRYPAVYISKRTWEDDFSNPEKEEPTEETACAMDPNEWLDILVWLQEKAYKIHSQIDSKMFCEMRAMAGDSKLLAKIIIEIGELAEYNSVDVMTEFRRILKERKQ